MISFRDDEVSATHPLRRVIGELPAAAMTRIDLARLSPAGVETLARRALRTPGGLFAATQGNPFFVTELLRHRLDEVPRTVQDLVLARFARLDKPAQAIVRLAAIVPGRLERWLLDALLAPELPALEACLDSGLLLADATSLGVPTRAGPGRGRVGAAGAGGAVAACAGAARVDGRGPCRAGGAARAPCRAGRR